jgi:hypothetical protein
MTPPHHGFVHAPFGCEDVGFASESGRFLHNDIGSFCASIEGSGSPCIFASKARSRT